MLDDFPAEHIDLIIPGVQSITSIKYLDTLGTEQTLAAGVYALDADSTPNRSLLKYDQQWPDTQDVPNAVRIRYVVGYGASSSSVPQNIRLWIIAQVCAALDNQAPPAWLDRLLDADLVHRV